MRRKPATIPISLTAALAFTPVIECTQEVIENSVRRDSGKCMVKMAIAFSIAEARYIVVTRGFIKFSLGNHRYTYITPVAMAEKVIAFDDDKEVAPWTMRLPKPSGVVPFSNRPKNMGGQIQRRRSTQKSKRWSSSRWLGDRLPK